MSSNAVVIIKTEVANIASVEAGLKKAGAEVTKSADPMLIAEAERVVLPGVGTFGASMTTLQTNRLDTALRSRIEAGRPTLLVCVGFQLLFSESEESPGSRGLGIINAAVKRFPPSVRVPQFGWNEITPDAECRLLNPGFAYFANSYRAEEKPQGWQAAYAENGGRFIAALERGPILACQFHPELSGPWGKSLLTRWMETA